MQPAPLRTPCVSIEEMDVAVWLFPLERHSEKSAPARAHRRAAGRDLLRSALSASTASGVAPEAWRFASGPLGRPCIAAPAADDLRFSMSYGDGALAVAVSRQGDVGVDIEPLGPGRLAEIPWSELCPGERARLRQTPEHERYECFARIWTLKEAFAKYTGCGAFLRFSSIGTTPDPPGIAGADLAVHQQDVTVGDRRHALTVCGARASRSAGGLASVRRQNRQGRIARTDVVVGRCGEVLVPGPGELAHDA